MDWMNINEISKVIDTPAPTVRRYIQKHQAFLNAKKQGKKILLHPDSIELLKKIRKWYVVDNMIDIEIDNKLKSSGYKTFIDVESINHESIEHELDSSSLDFVKAMFKEQRAINEQLMENNKLLVEEIKEIKQSYKESESKREQRDLALMEIVRSMQETKKSIAASEEKKKWWEFWK
ncbi:DUF3967 domain-containing protein [Priestia megaterium]|uniref:DUF3967 domain-containing protein n=1 Tax=Priestia megaterium TaxID=1404 RepID=UPI000BEBF478|nr:DUF3967 domain-containing protein [Priestia megaterium]PEC41651.1 hypothetical protein CON11_27425 [Priestia megaterium]PER72641.1 hypothetical protein CN492_22755 [Priestia megaterium]PET67142.1 hypothetical protein CN533_28450 [Priestia megaterium]PFK81931.1 hypothetical protein COJ19_26580 [Priestia megaterium]